MKRENIGILSSASLLFAAILVLAYIYIYGVFSPVDVVHPVGVSSIVSGDLRLLQSEYPILSTLLSLVILVVGGVLNLSVSTRYSFFGKASQIPLFFYVCYVVGFATSNDILSAPLAAFFGVCSLRDFYRAYHSSLFTSKLFTASFWMGFLPMLYPSTIVLWFAAFLFLILFVRSLRETIVVFVGLILPLVSFIYVKWLFGESIDLSISQFFGTITVNTQDAFMRQNILSIVLALFAALMSLYGVLCVGGMSLRYVARIRIYCAYILVGLGVVMLLLPSFSFESYVAIASPLSIAVTPVIFRVRSWLSTPLFLVILILTALSLLNAMGWTLL